MAKRIRAGIEKTAAVDSYTNPAARLGVLSNNLANQGGYVTTRITQNYQLITTLYRSSWIVRRVVDAPAEDMLKDMPLLMTQREPDDITKFNRVIDGTGTQGQMLSCLKLGRLYGGAIGLIVIAGHENLAEPLNLDDVELGAYKGIIPFDRWSGVQPSSEVVTSMDSPREFGLPEFYRITPVSGAVITVHHSRVVRFAGRELPRWEAQIEQHWGLAEPELIYDELQKRDYTSWNIVSLITRAQILAISGEEQLAQSMSGLTGSDAAFTRYVSRMSAMSDSMNNQGLLVLGKDAHLDAHQNSFGGLSDIYNTFMLDIAGACETPVSRLYGRTITGLGQSGEGDLQVYYDTIEQKRNRELRPQFDKLYRVVCMSTWGEIPEDFEFNFLPMRTLSHQDKAELAVKTVTAITQAYQADLFTKYQAVKEIKQTSETTGIGSNITDEDLAELERTGNTYASQAGGGELDFGDPKGLPEPDVEPIAA